MNPWENLRAVAAQVVAARPEGVLVCGDAARLQGRVEDYQELRALLEPVAAVSPVYVALGNHDDRENFLKVFPDPVPRGRRVAHPAGRRRQPRGRRKGDVPGVGVSQG